MEEISVKLGERSYNIYIDYGQLEKFPELMKRVITFERVLVVSNTTVGDLYGEEILDLLNSCGFSAELFSIPDGERYKEIETLRTIYDFLIENNYPRQSTILALGGGSCG